MLFFEVARYEHTIILLTMYLLDHMQHEYLPTTFLRVCSADDFSTESEVIEELARMFDQMYIKRENF